MRGRGIWREGGQVRDYYLADSVLCFVSFARFVRLGSISVMDVMGINTDLGGISSHLVSSSVSPTRPRMRWAYFRTKSYQEYLIAISMDCSVLTVTLCLLDNTV